MLDKEAVWAVFSFIRKSGLEGRTVKEIAQELDEPVSTIYGAIESLEREGFIKGVKFSKLKKWGRHPKEMKQKGKVAKKYFESCELKAGLSHREEAEKENPWGDVIFSPDFYNKIGGLITKQPELKQIQEAMIRLSSKLCREKITSDLSESSRKFLPSKERCQDCSKSHEGYEFLKAIMLFIATECVDSSEFKNLMKELGYSG